MTREEKGLDMDEKEQGARDALLDKIKMGAENTTSVVNIEALARAYRAVVGGPQPTSLKVESK